MAATNDVLATMVFERGMNGKPKYRIYLPQGSTRLCVEYFNDGWKIADPSIRDVIMSAALLEMKFG